MAEFLDPVREELDRLRAAENDAVSAYDDTLVKLADSMADADRLLIRLEQAEARVDQLSDELALTRDTLTHRTRALNETGTTNDTLRAQLAAIEKLAAWFESQPNWNEWRIHHQIRAALRVES